MLRSMIAAALAFAVVASLGAAAEAKPHQRTSSSVVTQFCGARYGACSDADALPVAGRATRRTRTAGRGGYRRRATPAGMVTVATDAGIDITCSPSFAGEAVALIADAVINGIKFSRITCYSTARSHRHRHGVCVSNHCSGEAFDSHPSIPASLVRQHGLRSGCDFHDCQHVDNARKVGGVAFWNSVKHKGPTITASAGRRHHHRRGRSIKQSIQ